MKFPSVSIPAGIKHHFTKKRLFIAGGFLTAVLIAIPVVTYANLANEISDPNRLMNNKTRGFVIEDRNGETLFEYGTISAGEKLELDEISDYTEQALIAAEDKGFYEHEGYSVRGIVGAVRDNIMNKDATTRGGSTITQQLVKNKLLTNEKTFLRKYQEVTMAVAVERRYTKNEILSMYLNSVYFGEGAFGIDAAADSYFNKNPEDLTIAESAQLIGLLPAPSLYSPINGDPNLAKEQQQRVLAAMVDAGYITEDEKVAAESQELQIAASDELPFSTAQHFILMVRDELDETYSEERVIRSGFTVTTTLNKKWQETAESIVKENIAEFSALGGRNAGLVSIDPENGEVRALVGSVDWENETFGKVNMAFAERQPGSSFKPIYYAEALEQKLITPATVMKDEKKTYGTDYEPMNYDNRFRGDITIRNALAQSLNIPAVDVMQKLGTYDAARTAQEMGIKTVDDPDRYGLSLALGTADARLYDMVNAYAAFANEGNQFAPTIITRIVDKYGDEIFKHETATPKEVVSPEASYLISHILSDESARAPLYGSSLNIPKHSVAAKTGTTDDNKDAWTIGYTPKIVTGVWVGNNESEPMTSLAGGSSAGRIWQQAMTRFLEDTGQANFERPADIVEAQACTADQKSSYREVFIRGTEPKQPCVVKKPEQPKPQKREKREEKQEEKEEKREEREVGGRGGGGPEPTPEPEEPPEEPAPDEPPVEKPEPEDPPEESSSSGSSSGGGSGNQRIL